MGTFAWSRSNKFIMYEFIRLIMNTSEGYIRLSCKRQSCRGKAEMVWACAKDG